MALSTKTSRYLRYYFFIPCLFAIGLLFLVWTLTPVIAKHYISQYFEEQGENIHIKTLSLDLFPLGLSIKDAKVTAKNDVLFSLESAKFSIRTLPLFHHTLHFRNTSVSGLNLHISQINNEWHVAGINLAQYKDKDSSPADSKEETKSPNEAESDNPSTPWKVILPDFTFSNANVLLDRQTDRATASQQDKIVIDTLKVQNLSGSELTWQGDLSLKGGFNKAKLTVDSQFQYTPKKATAQITVQDSLLHMADFAHFLPSPYSEGQGSLNLEGKATFSQTSANGTINLDVNNLTLLAKAADVQMELPENASFATKEASLKLEQTQFQLKPDNVLNASGSLSLATQSTAFHKPELQTSYDSLALTSQLSLSKKNTETQVQVGPITLNLTAINVTQNKTQNIQLADANLTADSLDVTLKGSAAPVIKGTSLTLNSQGLDAKLDAKKRAASWDKISISGVNVSQQGKKFNVQVKAMEADNLVVSEPITEQSMPLAKVGKLMVNNLEADQDGSHVENIETKDVSTHLLFNQQRQLDNLVFTEASQKTSPTAKESNSKAPREKDAQNAIEKTDDANADPAFKAPYYVIIDKYSMTGASSLYVRDQGISPTLQRTLAIQTLVLQNLNTQDAKQPATLTLKATSGRYTSLQTSLTIWPMAEKLTLKDKLKVREAELPPFSPYIADVLGYQIDSGQLDLDLDLTANNGQLKGNSHLVLRQFDLGGKYESSNVIKAGAIPLNIAVGFMKDSDDNIDLDIPLTGNVESPEFGWQGFLIRPVQNALFKASSNYLLQTFIPYANVITIAQLAGDQLLKIRVEPLKFEAKQTDLSDSQNTFLKQLVALMKDKKDSQLKACGIASYQDLGLEKPTRSIEPEARSNALSLAEQRAQNLKDYLVDQGITSSRIYLCSPAVDLSKSSTPRVELNF